jgi:multisubunit Na+/H+ antiporter MnhB subunit
MKKADWQYVVNTLLFICLVGIVLIGLLLGLVIPQGPSTPESSKYFLNLHRHQWGNIHFLLSLAFIFLIIIHLTLDWKWIKGRATRLFKERWKTALISTAGISLLLLFTVWLFYPKEPGAYEGYGIGRGKSDSAILADNQDYITVTGQVTLQDLEEVTGIPSRRIIEALGLPGSISTKDTIGRLRKKHGFSLVDLRDVLADLLNEKAENQRRLSAAQDYPNSIPETEEKPPEKIPEAQGNKVDNHEEEERITRGRLAEDQSGILITGQMSFYDIQRQTGIQARLITNRLGLPANVPLMENIGRLRRRYRFTLQDVRDIVESVIEKK